MRHNFLLLVSIILLSVMVGCNSEDDNLSQKINETMGVEVYFPQFDGLDVSVVQVYYGDDEEPRSVHIQYSTDVSEDVLEHGEYPNINILYGPYDNNPTVMYSFSEKVINIEFVSGERFQVGDVEGVIQEQDDNDNFQYHLFVINNDEYVIGYDLDYFIEEEALELTKDMISNIVN